MDKFHKISLGVYLIIISVYELIFFYNNFSGIDQIRHLAWVHYLRDSTHLLTIDFFNNYKSIFYDHYGFVYELLRYAYKDIGHILNIVPILITYIFSFFIGLTPNLLKIVSIIFSNLSIYISFLICTRFIQDHNKINKIILLILFVFIFSVNNIFLYSSLGIHNISLFFFLIAIYYFIKKNNFYNFKSNFFLCFIISLACYSHKINALLLPAGIIFYFILNKKDYKKKFKEILFSTINFFIFFSPIIILLFFTNSTIEDNLQYAQINFNFPQKLLNIKQWIIINYNNVGIINLTIFCLAITYFLIIKRNEQVLKIFSILFIHFIFSIFIDGFISYHIRTTLYSTFIILLINFIFVLFLIPRNNKLIYALIPILTINFSIQLSYIYNLDSIKKNRADYYNFYFYNLNDQHYTGISDIIKKIDKTTKGDRIIFNSNLSEDIYYVYSENNFKEIKFEKLRPTKNLIYYQNKKIINSYLDKINFKKIEINNSYFLAITNYRDNVSKDFDELNKSEIFLNKCNLENNPIHENDIFMSGQKKISLFKIKC